ncbi:MAG TPA: DUF3500 domain-containing protein [Cyclobacteriaceae bacterium]|jgi:hypothetical protein|nr:DUF3500 domain-containing protein [Cyclobacteriaceae bacterium]
MKKHIGFILLLCTLTVSFVSGQSDYFAEIKTYSTQLYASLGKLQKQAGLLSFNDTSRLKWNNLPVGLRARAGVGIGNMTNEQRMLVHRILSASLSSQGYLKSTAIMHLDELINGFYDSLYAKKTIDERTYGFVRKLNWSPKNYYFAFFGSPSDVQWGFKLEGHHLSINFTFVGERISVTPFFIGTDPAEYLVYDYAGWRVLNQEEDLGLRLVNSLTEMQKKKAIQSTAVPRDIITSAESGKRLIDNWGIPSADLNKNQRAILQNMIREFVFNMESEKAIEEYSKIEKAGLDHIYFGWIGALEEKQGHYYVINGPTFLIEFDNSGGPRNEANHIHSIWREKGNEYGEDVLKKHYQIDKH